MARRAGACQFERQRETVDALCDLQGEFDDHHGGRGVDAADARYQPSMEAWRTATYPGPMGLASSAGGRLVRDETRRPSCARSPSPVEGRVTEEAAMATTSLLVRYEDSDEVRERAA